jgi:hypothetical protein
MRYACSKYSQDGELRARTYVYQTDLDKLGMPSATVDSGLAEMYCRRFYMSQDSVDRGDYWVCYQISNRVRA